MRDKYPYAEFTDWEKKTGVVKKQELPHCKIVEWWDKDERFHRIVEHPDCVYIR